MFEECCAFDCSTTDLTLVIIGALFDLRSAPPPVPPAAPAHWSTSIRSIFWSAGPAVAARSAGLRPFVSSVELLLKPGGSPTRRPHEQQTRSRQVSGMKTEAESSLPQAPLSCPTVCRSVIYKPLLRFICCCLQRKFKG